MSRGRVIPAAHTGGGLLPGCPAGQGSGFPWSSRIPASLDNSLLHAIETIIIDWSHQIRDVLSKDSAQALLDGLHPLPRVEFEFWEARLMNLKCIDEQVSLPCPGQRPRVLLRMSLPSTSPRPQVPPRRAPGETTLPRSAATGPSMCEPV